MTHFTDEDLRRWSASGPGTDRERLIAHLSACGACASRYADEIRSRPLEPGAELSDGAGEFASAGYASAGGTSRIVRFPAGLKWAAGLAAAAAVVFAVLFPATLHAPSPVRVQFRGSAMHALSPAGAVDPSVAFSWSGATGTVRFEIGDATRTLYSQTPAESGLTLPPYVRSTLRAGVEYWWSASAVDPAGRVESSTGKQTFTIRPQ